jgi:hypothetical protein
VTEIEISPIQWFTYSNPQILTSVFKKHQSEQHSAAFLKQHKRCSTFPANHGYLQAFHFILKPDQETSIINALQPSNIFSTALQKIFLTSIDWGAGIE